MLSEKELGLYARQLGLRSWGPAVQEKLKKSKVFVAGAGGLGSPVLLYLASVGVGHLTVCDPDVVDISNLNRQILHAFNSIGVSKVDSAKRSIQQLNPLVDVRTLNERITDKNSMDVIGNCDLIVDCLDNFETRYVVNRVSVERRIPMVHAGVSGFGGQLTFLQPPETPCLACFMDIKDKEETNYIVGATAGFIGSLQALEAVKYLAGFGPSLKNRVLFWDGLTMKFDTMNVKRNPRCGVCGTA
ncbi:MAG: HesA/MoeB/ThiF family protein [Spirochaetes bacterium]|nr:HesA/MoeB/ThiF family protein [Spirochaetota bacterium]